MRNVERSEKPRSLRRNAKLWKQEYLRAIEDGDLQITIKCRKRYNQKDIRNSLNKMYRDMCCYCEGVVSLVGAGQIEHRKPVKLFPEDTFQWENLHLACPHCNKQKNNKWDKDHPILDAVADIPIGQHLSYKSTDTGILRSYSTKRGFTTVKHTDLNREALRHGRGMVFMGTIGIIQKINTRIYKNPNDCKAQIMMDMLKDKCLGPYGSLITWTMRKFIRTNPKRSEC